MNHYTFIIKATVTKGKAKPMPRTARRGTFLTFFDNGKKSGDTGDGREISCKKCKKGLYKPGLFF